MKCREQRILLLFAHPAYRRSRVNRALLQGIADLPGVTFRDLYELYPDFAIDVDREQALLVEHQLVIFQNPFLWYSVPALMKEWFDLVLEHGFAYGRHGNALHGKGWLSVVTAGGSAAAYGPDGFNHYTIPELLAPLRATARLCGMAWQAPVIVAGTHHMTDHGLTEAVAGYRARLESLLESLGDPGDDQGENRHGC